MKKLALNESEYQMHFDESPPIVLNAEENDNPINLICETSRLGVPEIFYSYELSLYTGVRI